MAIEPKAFRALLFLLHNPQRLISKEELLNAVWGDAAVTEGSLTRCIWLLRTVLGDDTRSPHYIETVPTVGYSWVCKVDVLEEDSEEPLANEEQNGLKDVGKAVGNKKRSRGWVLAGSGELSLFLVGVFWYLRRNLKDRIDRKRTAYMGLDPSDASLLLRDIGSHDIYALSLEEK